MNDSSETSERTVAGEKSDRRVSRAQMEPSADLFCSVNNVAKQKRRQENDNSSRVLQQRDTHTHTHTHTHTQLTDWLEDVSQQVMTDPVVATCSFYNGLT